MAKQVDLLASYWTMASGAEPHTDHEYSTSPFADRVAAAARAGFTGFGIWHADLEHTLRSTSLGDMRRILFELMPFARVNTLEDALDLVTSAAAPNGGIVLDLWHLVKLGIAYEDAARFPIRFIGGIEINDGTFTAPWSLFEDTINHRRFCGDGEFDVRGFVITMLDAGYQGPWGIEVLNSELRKLPPAELAERAATTTRAQFPA